VILSLIDGSHALFLGLVRVCDAQQGMGSMMMMMMAGEKVGRDLER